jgi:hypothetical protein
MALLSSWLLLLAACPDASTVGLLNHLASRLLAWSVAAGMKPWQVEKVFGRPELMESFTDGPINAGAARTTTTFYYLERFGVVVTFPPTPVGLSTGEGEGERVQGGVQP